MGHNAGDLQQRFIDLYTSLNDLVEYLQINREVRLVGHPHHSQLMLPFQGHRDLN